ncbi:capsular polysaccharide biosynthesis protein [Labrys okinawensis]|uniref:capsular polysaccharide biosynthesis protein n=1 Tax=Labrys okinawensis TaxID=346911 RepID=UPI0039BC2CC5
MNQAWLPPQGARIGVPSITLRNLSFLPALLPNYRLVPLELNPLRVDAVLGWGRKLPARGARRLAQTLGHSYLTAEDGFIRSVGLGKQRATSVCITLDDRGVYYDAASPSRLELMLAEVNDSDTRARATDMLELITRERLTKYNHLPDRPLCLGSSRGRRRILLVEQVEGDLSISGAFGEKSSFHRMLTDALADPHADVFIRAHPDVSSGRAKGSFANIVVPSRVGRIEGVLSPHAILDAVDEVWTVSSQLGFDALLRGLKVRCYGVPFYAGWGLTRDELLTPAAKGALDRRAKSRSRPLDRVDLVDVALLRFPLYTDPVLSLQTEPEAAIDRILLWRRHSEQWRGHTWYPNAPMHKRKMLRRYCDAPDASLSFGRTPKTVDRILQWGSKSSARCAKQVATPNISVEDGFLRSVGLGRPGNQPISLAFDSKGLYYDASRPSDLEILLEAGHFPPPLLARAERLRESILAANLTKYNLSGDVHADLLTMAGTRRRLLVIAQVPDDQSILLGMPTQPSNMALLKFVRDTNPGAFVVFKEHPDLVSGRRSGRTEKAEVLRHADHYAVEGAASAWIDFADEVHVRTSLAGFEALLRCKPVTCHGAPFYAGWGLTRDHVRINRRTRSCSLNELVAASLIQYPAYLHPKLSLPMEAEDAVAWLADQRRRQSAQRR